MFKPIPNYPGYEISEAGTVRSLKYHEPRLLKPQSLNRGYQIVSLHVHGIPKQLTVHSLVLLTFVGPRPEGQCIRHLDNDPANNNLDNLVYGSLTDNQQDRLTHGTYGMTLNARKVKVIRGLRHVGWEIKRIASLFGVSKTCIYRVTRRLTWSNIP